MAKADSPPRKDGETDWVNSKASRCGDSSWHGDNSRHDSILEAGFSSVVNDSLTEHLVSAQQRDASDSNGDVTQNSEVHKSAVVNLAHEDPKLQSTLSDFCGDTFRPMNIYFRLGCGKAVAIRVNCASRDQALQGLRACIEDSNLSPKLSQALEQVLLQRLASSDDGMRQHNQIVESRKKSWKSHLLRHEDERIFQRRQRLYGRFPWIQINCPENVSVVRRAIKALVHHDQLLHQVSAFEAKCSNAMQELIKKFSVTESKLKAVQQHELQFMQNSGSEENGFSKGDLDQLLHAHHLSLERLLQEQQQQLQTVQNQWSQDYKMLVLSLVGGLRNDDMHEVILDSIDQTQSSKCPRTYDLLNVNDDDVTMLLHRRGLCSLRPTTERSRIHEGNKTSASVSASASGSVLISTSGELSHNLAVVQPGFANWLGQLVQRDVVQNNLSKRSLDSKCLLDPLHSTFAQTTSVFLGAQSKTQLQIRVEAIVGGLFSAMQKSVPSCRDIQAFSKWRQESLAKVFPMTMPEQTSMFMALAIPQEREKVFLAATRGVVDLLQPYVNGNSVVQVSKDVQATYHTNLGLGILCVLHGPRKSKPGTLGEVVLQAATLGVSHLVIPLRDWILDEHALMAEELSTSEGKIIRSPLDRKAVDAFVRSLRAVLADLAHRRASNHLREVILVLKSSCSKFFDQARNHDGRNAGSPGILPDVKVTDSRIVSKLSALIASAFDTPSSM